MALTAAGEGFARHVSARLGIEPGETTPDGKFTLKNAECLAAWQSPEEWSVWVLFATLGFWGGLGHWFLILAHRIAPAGVLAPYIYLGLIWMSAAGFLLFDDIPTLWTLAGGAIVILAGLYLLARERKAQKEGPAAQVDPQ